MKKKRSIVAFGAAVSNCIKRLVIKFFCEHDMQWVRNIYGDEINYTNGKRSMWKCNKCDKTEYRRGLIKNGQ
jgi:hypothetical protein